MKESIDSKLSSQQAQNYFEYLPDELYGEIFSHFKGRELSMAAQVSTSFYRNAKDSVMLGKRCARSLMRILFSKSKIN